MLLHFSRSYDKNNVHIILFPILSSSHTISTPLPLFTIFRHIILKPKSSPFCQKFPIQILRNYSIAFLFSYLPITTTYPLCSTCEILHSNFAILQNTLPLLLSQPSSHFVAPLTEPAGNLRVFLQNIPCTL
jgi:hypothetical protein